MAVEIFWVSGSPYSWRALLTAEGITVGRLRIRDFDRKRYIFRK